jgi:hypothetical protein
MEVIETMRGCLEIKSLEWKLKMGNIKPGDIIISRAGNTWISKTIAWLTASDVSHAAIVLEDGRIAEMGLDGLFVNKIEIHEGDDDMLLRLLPEKDPAPLMKAAQIYIDSEVRYDFPALAFIGGLIVYRNIRPTKKLNAVIDLVLRSATVVLTKMIQKIILKNPGKALICSQLVYQVYEDCGREYSIHIENGLLQTVRQPDIASVGQGANGGVCLADLAQNAMELESTRSVDEDFPSDEELAERLYEALSDETLTNEDLIRESGESVYFSEAESGVLLSSVRHFLETLAEFLEKSRNQLPLNALFVTPADLAYKAKNLDTIGRCQIKRQ